MDETPPPCPAEAVAMALAKAMLRKGLLDESDIEDAAAELDREDPTAAHLLRCAIVEVAAPSVSEWKAEKARARFRVVEGGEG